MNDVQNHQEFASLIPSKDMLFDPILSAIGLKWQNLAPYNISHISKINQKLDYYS